MAAIMRKPYWDSSGRLFNLFCINVFLDFTVAEYWKKMKKDLNIGTNILILAVNFSMSIEF